MKYQTEIEMLDQIIDQDLILIDSKDQWDQLEALLEEEEEAEEEDIKSMKWISLFIVKLWQIIIY